MSNATTISDLVARARRVNRSLTFAYDGFARVVLPHKVEGGLLYCECLSACEVRTFSVEKIEGARLGWKADELAVPVPKLELCPPKAEDD